MTPQLGLGDRVGVVRRGTCVAEHIGFIATLSFPDNVPHKGRYRKSVSRSLPMDDLWTEPCPFLIVLLVHAASR